MSDSNQRGLQSEFWNGPGGRMWVERIEDTHRIIAPLGEHIVARAAVKPGEAVLDVGCGDGFNSRQLAGQTGSAGRVTAVDVSEIILDYARRQPNNPTNLNYVLADAATADLGAQQFDVLFSRFGVMFFEDPKAAFANLRSALKPGGRVAYLAWQAPALNPWLSVPAQAVFAVVPPPAPPEARAPGPFAFAEREWINQIMDAAGFANVAIEGLEVEVSMGSLDDAVHYMMRFGPAVEALQAATDSQRQQVEAAIRSAFAPMVVDGEVRGPTATWIVTASRG